MSIQLFSVFTLILWISLGANSMEISGEFNNEQRALLKEDLDFIYSLEPSYVLIEEHKQVFGGISSGETYQQYFDSMVSSIKPDFDKKICGQGMKACAGFERKSAPTPIWLGDFYFRRNVTREERVVLLLHEARHNAGFPHDVNCYGKTMCDSHMLGGWGAEFLFVMNMLERSRDNRSDYIAWDSRLQAVSTNFREVGLNIVMANIIKHGHSARAIEAVLKYWVNLKKNR